VEERTFRPAFKLPSYCHPERSEAQPRDLRFVRRLKLRFIAAPSAVRYYRPALRDDSA